MGIFKSELQNLIYGNKIKSPLMVGETLYFQNSIYYYQQQPNWAVRAVIGITDKRIVIEPTVVNEKHRSVGILYADILSVEAGRHAGAKLGLPPAVIDIALRDGTAYHLYATTKKQTDTQNMLGQIRSAWDNYRIRS